MQIEKEISDQMQTQIKAYLFERIREETRKYVLCLNSRSESPYFSDFDRSIMLLTNVSNNYENT